MPMRKSSGVCVYLVWVGSYCRYYVCGCLDETSVTGQREGQRDRARDFVYGTQCECVSACPNEVLWRCGAVL
jgi:hypothetical protein